MYIQIYYTDTYTYSYIYLHMTDSTSHALPTLIEIYALMRLTLVYMFGLATTSTSIPTAAPTPIPSP